MYAHQASNPSERGGKSDRGAIRDRGGQGDREYSDRRKLILKDPVSLPHPWRNEVDNLLCEMRIEIMKEIKLVITTAISSQISKIAIAMATQIKTANTDEMSTATTEMLTLSPSELDEEIDLITQLPTMTNAESTPMEVDTDPRKRKVPNDNEDALKTNRITPTRSLRPQTHRGLLGTPKKTLKEGQKTD